MNRLGQLFELQQIDSGLDSRLARMRQLDAQMVDSPELIAARAAHEEARAVLVGKQAELKHLSHEAEDTSTRLKTFEKRLYDGSIKNPKELSQVQEEVGHLRSRFKTHEESMLDLMLVVEEAETAVADRASDLEKVQKDWELYQNGLMEEKDKLTSQAKVLQVKRQRSVAEIAWADLQAYERLRRSRGGIAVAAVHNGICGGCHVGVPAHVLRVARTSTEFTTCPSCGRILYPAGEVKFEEFNHDLDNINR